MAAYRKLDAKDLLDLYFIENRARLLDIAAFLDRIERYDGADQAKEDFRYAAFAKALDILKGDAGNRTVAIQLAFSDLSTEPVESAAGLKAVGAWDGGAP